MIYEDFDARSMYLLDAIIYLGPLSQTEINLG